MIGENKGRQRLWRCLPFLSLFGMENKERPKGQRLCRRPLGCHSGHLSAHEQRPPFRRLAPSANQQAELHSLWEKAPGYVPAHRGGWGEVPAAPAADAADGFRSGPLALGAAQDAGEAAQRRAFLKWTQGEAMTAQEKALVEDLWNTDPHRASEYWAAGEFLDTGVPTSSALDGGGLDGTMKPEGATRIVHRDGTVEIVGKGEITKWIDNRPYLKKNSRPSFRKKVPEQTFVYLQTQSEDGLVRDPLENVVINWDLGQPRRGVWDMGHIPTQKYSDVHARYVREELTPEEFRDWYNDYRNYRAELPSTNRSHKME